MDKKHKLLTAVIIGLFSIGIHSSLTCADTGSTTAPAEKPPVEKTTLVKQISANISSSSTSTNDKNSCDCNSKKSCDVTDKCERKKNCDVSDKCDNNNDCDSNYNCDSNDNCNSKDD